MERVSEEEFARGLLKIWEVEVRPVLVEHLQGEIDGLDQTADLLKSALKRKTHLQIGFIGESQVGKSSLINALVERSALPSGGIGPLTAQATQRLGAVHREGHAPGRPSTSTMRGCGSDPEQREEIHTRCKSSLSTGARSGRHRKMAFPRGIPLRVHVANAATLRLLERPDGRSYRPVDDVP